MPTIDSIQSSLREAQDALAEFLSNKVLLAKVDEFVELLAKTFNSGNKVYSAGNGGSHCDAMHFAEEWTGRYRKDRKPMPALAFADPSHMSCVSNDYGFEHVFERMIEAFGEKGDVFLAITTSGKNAGGKVVGIDLGTTNSLVAYVEFGEAKVISGRDGGLVPSVVTIGDDGSVIAVGVPAKRRALIDAGHTVYSVKRLMGKSYSDV